MNSLAAVREDYLKGDLGRLTATQEWWLIQECERLETVSAERAEEIKQRDAILIDRDQEMMGLHSELADLLDQLRRLEQRNAILEGAMQPLEEPALQVERPDHGSPGRSPAGHDQDHLDRAAESAGGAGNYGIAALRPSESDDPAVAPDAQRRTRPVFD